MFEMWSWTIAPGDVHWSDAHSRGARELVSVLQGSLKITVGSETIVLQAGEAARLLTDQPAFVCGCRRSCRFIFHGCARTQRGNLTYQHEGLRDNGALHGYSHWHPDPATAKEAPSDIGSGGRH
ncbi:cupin domain-containing protein [Mesorhizobium sp. M1396]|uniref:cupin domain-containing protein n=1 Tax=Mesorhizobium sp. M1396 TaxID=2957095 RepID=UPI00333C716C